MSSTYDEYERESLSVILSVAHYAQGLPDEVDGLDLIETVPRELRDMARAAVRYQGQGVAALDDHDDEGLLEGLSVPDIDEVFNHWSKLKRLDQQHRLVQGLLSAAEEIGSDDPHRVASAHERVTSLIASTAAKDNKVETVTLPDTLDDIKDEELDRTDVRPSGTMFDTWMSLVAGELGLIVAPPNRGKSSALVDVACGYVENSEDENGVVIVFSEEMSRAAVVQRATTRMLHESDFTREEMVDVWQEQTSKMIVEAHMTGTSTVEFLKHRVKMLLQKNQRPIAIIIDYLGVLTSPKKERYEQLSDIVKGLRAMGKHFECPVWTAVQPQRSPSRDIIRTRLHGDYEAPVLGMYDISECWDIPQVADYIVTINQTDEEKDQTPPKARLHRAKARWPNKDAPKNHTLDVDFDEMTGEFL